jgi:hypothetical protein
VFNLFRGHVARGAHGFAGIGDLDPAVVQSQRVDQRLPVVEVGAAFHCEVLEIGGGKLLLRGRLQGQRKSLRAELENLLLRMGGKAADLGRLAGGEVGETGLPGELGTSRLQQLLRRRPVNAVIDPALGGPTLFGV